MGYTRVLSLLFLLAFLVGCSNQGLQSDSDRSVGIAATVAGWFPVGEHTADIMDSVVYPQRMVALTERFKESIALHQEWFMEAIGELQDGEPLAYHPNMGLTPEEYAEYRSLTDSVMAYPSGQELLTISMEDSMLGFQGTGRLEFMDMIKIDLKENVAYISNITLPFADTVIVGDEGNSFRSTWRGYSWESGTSLDPAHLTVDSLAGMMVTHYGITVGKINRTNKTYIKVTAKEMNQGVKELNLELPIVF